MKKNLLFIALLFMFQYSRADQIIGLSTFPANPQTTDTVRIIVDCAFNSGSCDMHTENHSVTGSLVEVNVFHCVGMLSVICYKTDTILIGQLPAGTYHLTANLYSGPLTIPLCNHFTQEDTLELNFNVIEPSAISETALPEITFSQNGRNLSIKGNLVPELGLTILDITGKKCFESGIEKQGEVVLPSLNPGVYVYCLSAGSRNRFGKFIITD